LEPPLQGGEKLCGDFKLAEGSREKQPGTEAKGIICPWLRHVVGIRMEMRLIDSHFRIERQNKCEKARLGALTPTFHEGGKRGTYLRKMGGRCFSSLKIEATRITESQYSAGLRKEKGRPTQARKVEVVPNRNSSGRYL